jgi:hypothetical protein
VRRARAAGAALLLVLAGHVLAGGPSTVALLTDVETAPSTFSTAATFPDVTPPTVSASVISKSVPYLPGHIRQGGTYHVYANVTDAGSGVASVRADVSAVTTGQTSLALVAGTFSIGGVSYGYRSAAATANATLVAGAKAYTITAADVAGNAVTQGGFSVNVDNTRPTGSALATTNGGSIVGRPELGDTITLTFSEIIDPQSALAGWTGGATPVVVRIANAGGGDTLTVRNAANSAQLPLGSVNLGGTGYVTMQRDFGATGTPSTMIQGGASITITLGTPSGATTTQAGTTTMSWTPVTGATDRAANACMTTVVTEAAPADVEF